MRKTHEPQAALKALIAAVGVSTMVMASAPAHAGPLGFLKKAAEKELKKAAEDRLTAEAAKHGVSELTLTKTMDRAGLNSAANGDGFADIITGAGTGGGPQIRIVDGNRPQAADAEPQDAFMYIDAGSATAKGKVEASWKVEEGEAAAGGDSDHKDWIVIESMSGGSAYRGGVFLASGDVNGDGRDDIVVGPGLCKLVQNGTTVATAEDILSSLSDEEQSLWSRAKKTHNMTATCAKLVQNGTTVATASEILAQPREEPVALLLPAVQAVRVAARPTRAGMSQNGTTVPTADTVQQPETEAESSAIYIKICGVKGESKD